MANEIERLVDSVCKGYETAERWVKRYDALFADYEIMRKQYEELRNHRVYSDSKLVARCANLEESNSGLKSQIADLVNTIRESNTDYTKLLVALNDSKAELERYKRREDIRMGMQIFSDN